MSDIIGALVLVVALSLALAGGLVILNLWEAQYRTVGKCTRPLAWTEDDDDA